MFRKRPSKGQKWPFWAEMGVDFSKKKKLYLNCPDMHLNAFFLGQIRGGKVWSCSFIVRVKCRDQTVVNNLFKLSNLIYKFFTRIKYSKKHFDLPCMHGNTL